MARWKVAFTLERRGDVPLFQQIARTIAADIQRGRLRPGDALPGTRTLAHDLGVQRLTAVAAFDELVAEGWIVNRPARGAFVSDDMPDPLPRRFSSRGVPAVMADRTGYDLLPAPEHEKPYDVPRGSFLFAPTRPDVRLAPATAIGRALRRAMSQRSGELLSYGPSQGHPRLRQAVSGMLASTRGIAAAAENVCITRGSQMALSLLARVLLRPGDAVAVEQLGYRPAWEAFRLAGARIVEVPVDGEGMQVKTLERAIVDHHIRAVYVTPHHQFPTTVTLSAGRRLQLLDLARVHRFAVIEDDYDHEFHYDGRPVLPLASIDRFGVVAYVGTFSKVLAPACRLGYVAAPVPVIERIAAHRSLLDIQGDQVLEYAIAELLEEGEIQRHIRRVRREYRLRRDTLVEALSGSLSGWMTFDVPAGGIALWVRVDERLDVDQWASAASERGAIVITGKSYALDRRPQPFTRLGFASLNTAELREGVRRLAAARPRAARRPT